MSYVKLVLYGQRAEMKGSMMKADMKDPHTIASLNVVRPMAGLIFSVNSHSPAKKRRRAIIKTKGSASAMCVTAHFDIAGLRRYRARSSACGDG